jgi:23S rRNA U2552 (ribose-2'-O)-methylase RlmE/FtsJ
MSELFDYFENNKENCIDKWEHYFDIYDQWFQGYKNKNVTILEIGIFQGGSLNMWRNYFGENAQIYAIDINPECKQFEDANTRIFIGSQENAEFLEFVKSQIPKVDIVIDDGGHTMSQQITSFELLYEHVNSEGIYLCEDLHTSYWKDYGGGYKENKTFIEYSKDFIDKINAWHSRSNELTVDDFTLSTDSLHFYDSVLVIKKRKRAKPVSRRTGKMIIPLDSFKGRQKPLLHSKKNDLFFFFERIYKKIKFNQRDK